mgnify:CR=1 FL=1
MSLRSFLTRSWSLAVSAAWTFELAPDDLLKLTNGKYADIRA